MLTNEKGLCTKRLTFDKNRGSRDALSNVTAPLMRCRLLSSNHLNGDGRAQVVTQANGCLVRTRGLDRRRDLDLALVDRTEAGSRNRVSDVARLDRTEQTTLFAGFDAQLDGVVLENLLEVLSFFDCREFASGASSLDRFDLLFAAAAPRHREALGNQVVTCEAILDLDDITG